MLGRLFGIAAMVLIVPVSAGGADQKDPTQDPEFYPKEFRSLKNPIAFSPETMALGRKVYNDQQCVSCHGVYGDGKGDAASVGRFLPGPRDFTDAAAMAKKTDGMLFYSVSKGVHGTWMLPREKLLTEKDRWAVIHYIRTFADSPMSPSRVKTEEHKKP
jgi:mono/diheme cytochrome c family protein